jgi:hypothetical protein
MKASVVRFGGSGLEIVRGTQKTTWVAGGESGVTSIEITDRGTIRVVRSTETVEVWPPPGTMVTVEASETPYKCGCGATEKQHVRVRFCGMSPAEADSLRSWEAGVAKECAQAEYAKWEAKQNHGPATPETPARAVPKAKAQR